MFGTNTFFKNIDINFTKKFVEEDPLEFDTPCIIERPRLTISFSKVIQDVTNVIKHFPTVCEQNTENEVKEEDLYEDNGGTTLTIKLQNKLIIAADTRLNAQYNIYTRYSTKIHKIKDYFLTTVGFHADSHKIALTLDYQLKQYEQYDKMTLSALAEFLHHVLYNNRFFPLYSYCCLCGFENGEATIYSYDCIGSYQKTECRVNGSGTAMIQPLFDSWISGKNFENYSQISFEDALCLVKKAFHSAAEADVKTGDYLEIYILDNNKVEKEVIDLRKD
ncbi:20S proteasome core particle subunit beta 6 [Enterocytozoon bieneusi H348]|nr:20S proteasome core particle subunit beta 6 [Enterocytozoon bieneusi H348]|eukprot:XP_001827910.1 20S proteasome core particle subunit beta 6 [Enterocytozoon bieneusi H348]